MCAVRGRRAGCGRTRCFAHALVHGGVRQPVGFLIPATQGMAHLKAIQTAELVKDNVTLPIQRLREAVSELVKLSEDKDIGQELVECNRRLGELKVEVAEFLSQQAEDHMYWVERGGRAQRT